MDPLHSATPTPMASASKDVFKAKIISGVVLFVATVLCTLIPTCFVRRMITNVHMFTDERQRKRNVVKKHALSAFNCFAGGVFIAAGLLHVFVDADEDVKLALKARNIDSDFPFTMFIMLCGVFFLLIIEKTADFLAHRHSSDPSVQRLTESSHRQYDTEYGKHRAFRHSHVHSSLEETLEVEINHDHTKFTVSSYSSLQAIVLSIALSVHSVFEGLALGLQHTVAETYKILLVISLHKLVIAFSMGISLGQARIRLWLLLLIAGVFCLSSPIGTFVGAGVSEADHVQHGLIVGVLQSIACGSFVYVTFFEILPHEFNKKDCIRSLYMACLLLGFGAVALYTYFAGDADGDGHHHDHDRSHVQALHKVNNNT